MTTLLTITATPGAPVACDMTTADDTLAARLAEYRRLFEHALLGRTSTDTSTTFWLAARPGVEEWLLDLVRREAACCPFLSFDVEQVGEELVWHTEGIGASDWLALDDVLASEPGDSAELAQEMTDRTGVPHLVPGSAEHGSRGTQRGLGVTLSPTTGGTDESKVALTAFPLVRATSRGGRYWV